MNEVLRIGDDNICPVTNQPCDDECCPPGAECNLAGEPNLFDAPASPPPPATEGKEEDGGKWQRLSDTLLKRSDWAHAIAAEKGQYYSGLSEGLAQAVKQMESLLEDKIEPPTSPAGVEDTYTREEVKLILSQRESYFQNHHKGEFFLTTGEWLDKNYIPGLHLLQAAGAEGEGETELPTGYGVVYDKVYIPCKKESDAEYPLSVCDFDDEEQEWVPGDCFVRKVEGPVAVIPAKIYEQLSAAHNMIAGLKERLRITLSNFDVETADLRIARDRIAEIEKQLAKEKSFHANWRAIADQYEADKKDLEAKVQIRSDQMVTSSNRIEGLIEELAIVRQFRDNIAADKKELEAKVKSLQEWHDSHL